MSNCPPPSSRGMKMGVFRVKSQPEVMLTVIQLEFRFSVDFSFWRCLVLFSCIATFARSIVLKTVHAVVNCDDFATSVFKPVKVSMFKISTFISYHALFLEQQKNHYWLHWWCRQQWWQVCHSKQSILYGRFSIPLFHFFHYVDILRPQILPYVFVLCLLLVISLAVVYRIWRVGIDNFLGFWIQRLCITEDLVL